MEEPPSIAHAHDLVMWINGKLHDLEFPASDRNRISGACFAVAMEHHHAIAILLRERLNGSAFSLVRSVYEAYVRGVWLFHCATDDDLRRFIKGAEPPKLGAMLEALEALPTFDTKTLSHVKKTSWQAMCSYTHTGSLQVQRWNTSESITSSHSVGEIEEVLTVTNGFAILAGLGVATLADNTPIALEFYEKAKSMAAAASPDQKS